MVLYKLKNKRIKRKNRNVVEAHIKDFELVLNTFFNSEYKGLGFIKCTLN